MQILGLDPLLEQEGRAGSSYTGINLEKDTSGYGLKFIYPEIYAEWEGGNYDDPGFETPNAFLEKYKEEREGPNKKMEAKTKKYDRQIKENEPRWAAEALAKNERFQKC